MTTLFCIVLLLLQATTRKCFADFNLIDRIRATVTTSQSSIFAPINNPQDFNSRKAIDGLQNYSIDHCKCCSVTNGASPSWWQIDLGQKYLLGGLQIFGRATKDESQLEYAEVYASNVSMKPGKAAYKMKVYDVPSMNASTRNFTKQLDAIIAQYFLVELNQEVLTLCEFKLNEKECKVGYFGSGCLHSCHCSDNNRCDQVTGTCRTPGCLAGWKGEACPEACGHRRFGQDCTSVCHCLYNTSCNTISGECHNGICDPGWQTPSCDKACDFHTFGFNCSSTCHCLNNTNCNSTTGECGIGMCDPGWQGSSCDQACDHRSFGLNCSSTCHCLNNAACNGTTGNCVLVLCDSGWQGPRCDQVCDHRSFGYNCSSTCHCLNNTNCNSTTGTCITGLCDPGWQGPRCDRVCDYRAFGYNCSSTCHCLNNTDCNSSTGRCYIELCDFGWQGPRCDEEKNILRRSDVLTDMSSTFLNWTSNLAIDGSIGPKPDVCNCCSGTKNSLISWWTVDLGKRYPINSVTVFSREFDQLYQQLADFELYLANDTGKNSFHLVENSTRRIDGNKHVLTFSNKLTRFIKIQRPGVLTLCEVMVSEGECQVGTFGEECSEICHCADDLACDKTSGYCQSDACKSGWIGKSCNQECPKNRFGDRCSETCFCAEGTCTSNYGVCQNGCQQGYTGFHCNQVGDFNNHTRPANEEKNSSALIAVVIGGSIAVLIICVLVGVVVVKLRRKSSEGNKSHYSTPNSRANQDDQDYDTLDILNDNQGRRHTTYQNEVVSNM
ncbi:protein draper-like isoform X2 [Ruditapes philippinarum]|uniref:protein draper-like isoform X2 n=1 Tax=Ruditapes philippinarum TaxID=129788 RepID=UPI00295A5774|nr:protein draper-like isoform X2 [Ruditapes philippinarum]